MEQNKNLVSDYSFTNVFGDRFYFPNYSGLKEEEKTDNIYMNHARREKVNDNKKHYGYFAYYTSTGGVHIVGYIVYKNHANILGKYIPYQNGVIDKNQIELKLTEKLADVIKDSRDDFLGWSL